MIIPDILALDFDGVLCDGMREYFEISRRTYTSVWPDEQTPNETLFAVFSRLRPVIMTGWEMPLLLRAVMRGHSEAAILHNWETLRDELVHTGSLQGSALERALRHTLDAVRHVWIDEAPDDWLARNVPYCELDAVRRLVAEPECTVLVTTKEGEFARYILDHWGVQLADIQGKETGSHKCDNLRGLIAQYQEAKGRRPAVWFVEDRLETLNHVTTHADLDDVRLFLAAWGYNTADTRASLQDNGRIRLLELDQFRRGFTFWC